MEKELKIDIPEGYEIDRENSSFNNIVKKQTKALVTTCLDDNNKKDAMSYENILRNIVYMSKDIHSAKKRLKYIQSQLLFMVDSMKKFCHDHLSLKIGFHTKDGWSYEDIIGLVPVIEVKSIDNNGISAEYDKVAQIMIGCYNASEHKGEAWPDGLYPYHINS